MHRLLLLLPLILFSCVTPRYNLEKQSVVFKSLLDAKHPLLTHTVLIFGERKGDFAFCNGVYIGDRQVLTSGHCIFNDFNYWVFVPKKLTAENPFTNIQLEAVKVLNARKHPNFTSGEADGIVKFDIGVMSTAAFTSEVMKAAE